MATASSFRCCALGTGLATAPEKKKKKKKKKLERRMPFSSNQQVVSGWFVFYGFGSWGFGRRNSGMGLEWVEGGLPALGGSK